MDILQYLKSSNQLALSCSQSLLCGRGITDKNDLTDLRANLIFDRTYLIPEIAELNQGGSLLASQLLAVLTGLESSLANSEPLSDTDESQLQLFVGSLVSYSEFLISKVMPFVRANMTTADREELYQLYLDVSSELNFDTLMA